MTQHDNAHPKQVFISGGLVNTCEMWRERSAAQEGDAEKLESLNETTRAEMEWLKNAVRNLKLSKEKLFEEFQENESKLMEENATLRAKLALLESRREQRETANDILTEEVYHLLKDNIMSSKMMDTLAAAVAHLESVKDRKQAQILNLRARVTDLQSEVRDVLTQKDDLTEELSGVRSSRSRERAKFKWLKDKVLENQRDGGDGSGLPKLEKHLESWRNLETAKEKKRESDLTQRNNVLRSEVTLLRSEGEAKEKEIEKLREEIYDLIKANLIASQKIEVLTAEVVDLKRRHDGGPARMDSLRTKLEDLQSEMKELHGDDRMMLRLKQVESLWAGELAQIGKLREKVDQLKEKEELLSARNAGLVDELQQQRSSADKLEEQLLGQNKALRVLRARVEKAELSGVTREASMEQKNREIARLQQIVAELDALNGRLKENLRIQTEMRRDDEVAPPDSGDSAEEELGDARIAEHLTGGFWRRFAKCLRTSRMGLIAAIINVMVLVPMAAILVATNDFVTLVLFQNLADCVFGDSCSLLDSYYNYEFLYPY